VKYIREELSNKVEVELEEGEEEGKDSVVATERSAVALDPVLGKPITQDDISLCAPSEASEYIKRYNNVKEEPKQKKKKNDDKCITSKGSTEEPETKQ
jgi:hypothetical protein